MKKTIVLLMTATALASNIHADEISIEERLSNLETKLASLPEPANSLNTFWKNGFTLQSPDQSMMIQVGARFHLDTAFFSADDALEEAAGPFDDSVKFRRARMSLRGILYDNVEFITEYDFAGGLGFRNVFMGLKDIPGVGTIRAGHMIEPIGLEELSGNNFFPCMEAGISASFNPVFNTGIMAFNNVLDKRMTWAAGIFKDTGAFGDSVSNEEFAVTARITGLPYHADDGRRYAHFAYAMSHRELNEEGYRIRARPDSFISPSVLDTGVINADAADLVGFESLITFGSLSLQSEWVMTSTELAGADTSDADFAGYYVLLSYFLTGEHRPYNKSTGTFTRITPKRNATGKTWGSGAWEIVGRYGELDLNDSGIEGGQLATTTLGLNWYLNPNSRIMWNYVMADVENTGDVDIFQMRFQFDL